MARPQKADIANIFSSAPAVSLAKKDETTSSKKQLIYHMQETAKKQFDHLAVELGITKQMLMTEAVNDLFVKHGKPPIA